jgi:hypothetical protein
MLVSDSDIAMAEKWGLDPVYVHKFLDEWVVVAEALDVAKFASQ